MNFINLKLSNLSEAKARVVFAIKNKNVVWENVILVGVKKMGGLFLMCAISQRIGESTLRLEIGPLRRTKYISFLNEIVLPLYDRDYNCIFMQDQNRLSESNWAKEWQQSHPHVKFWNWPKYMKGVSPLNDVWINMNNVEDFSDFGSIFDCWNNFKEDFDDFKHVYTNAKRNLQILTRSEIFESDEED